MACDEWLQTKAPSAAVTAEAVQITSSAWWHQTEEAELRFDGESQAIKSATER